MKKRKKRPGQTQGHRPSPAWSQALALTPNQRASPRKTQWDAWISCHHRNSSTDGGWGHHHHHHQLRKWWRITHWKKKSTLLFVGDLCLWCFVCFLHIIICWKTKKTSWHLWNLSRSNPRKKRRLTTPPPPIDRKNKAPETWLSGSRSVHPRRRLPSAQSSPNRGFF